MDSVCIGLTSSSRVTFTGKTTGFRLGAATTTWLAFAGRMSVHDNAGVGGDNVSEAAVQNLLHDGYAVLRNRGGSAGGGS